MQLYLGDVHSRSNPTFLGVKSWTVSCSDLNPGRPKDCVENENLQNEPNFAFNLGSFVHFWRQAGSHGKLM